MLYKILLILILVYYNLCTNIYALTTYSDEDYTEEILNKPFIIRITHILWYWLDTIYRFGLIPYLIRLIFSAIISVLIMKLSVWLPTQSIEAFAILYCICAFNTGVVCTYGLSILYKMFKHIHYKRKKKIITNDNSKES